MKATLFALSVFALSAIMVAQTNIPVGTVIPATLNSTIDAKTCKPGQTVIATVAQDVPLANGDKIKAGTRVLGEVLEVTPPRNSQPATLVLRFNKIDISGRTTPVVTDLRALASPLEVEFAQTAVSGDDRGSTPPWSQTTTQIGDDVVYREQGTVNRGLKPVGKSVYAGAWGVLSPLAANPGAGCRGEMAGNNEPQALWVFSHDACGVYGYYTVITHAGRSNPQGRIELASSNGDLKVRSGSGMLLRISSANAGTSGDESAQK